MSSEADVDGRAGNSSAVGGVRDDDTLTSIAREVRSAAGDAGNGLDRSERDAMSALADRAEELLERLLSIIDWADFALVHANEFNSHGVRNLDGPIFDAARAAIAKATGTSSGEPQ